MVNPCRFTEKSINRIHDGIDTVIRGLVDSLNLVIDSINFDISEIVNILNIGIKLFGDFITGFLYNFNNIMRDCRSIIKILISITSGTIVGWMYLFFSPVITVMFSLIGIDMDMSLFIKCVKYTVYLMIFGNFYNLFDMFSTPYDPNSGSHCIGDCKSY